MDMYNPQLEQEQLTDVLARLQPIFYSSNPLYELLHQKVLAYPMRCAVTDGAISFSYAELLERVVASAQYLSSRGITTGMRVALYASNSALFYVWYYALHAVGAVVLLVPVTLHEREVVRIFEQAQPSFIVAEVAKMELVAASTDTVLSAPVIDVFTDQVQKSVVDGFMFRGRLIDEIAVVLYTSGSTGDPRGVVLSVRNILTNMAQCQVRMDTLGVDDFGERFLVVLPLTHAFGHMTCLWLPLVIGATTYVLQGVKRKELLEVFSDFKPTVFFMVPALASLMCTLYDLPTESIKAFVSGGDFLSSKVAAGFELLFGRRICSGYGLSEASPVVGVNINPRSSLSAVITPLLPGINYKIIPSTSHTDAFGELFIQSDSVFQGYFERANEPLKSPLLDGWLPTGDLVQRLSDGSLTMIGRSKDIIVFKAFNIYPQEIERVLLLHSQVYMAAVVGLDHEVFGQIPVALVGVKPGARVEEKELAFLCKAHLASYKIPHKILVTEQMPLNHLGKVDRKTVKKMIES